LDQPGPTSLASASGMGVTGLVDSTRTCAMAHGDAIEVDFI